MDNMDTAHKEYESSDAIDESYTGCATTRLTEEISAYLFVSSKPVSLERLSRLAECDEEEIKSIIQNINTSLFESGLGFEILAIQDSFQMRTKPSVTRALHKLITPKMKRLSKAAAETLAVIAYKQPVSKAEIEVIRGVDPVPTLKTLIDGKLIRIVGREDTPGSPALYGTTDHFLERFGLKNLSELPTVRELDSFEDEDSSNEDSFSRETSDESITDAEDTMHADETTEAENEPITIS
jgi:segregation and condensation protein B